VSGRRSVRTAQIYCLPHLSSLDSLISLLTAQASKQCLAGSSRSTVPEFIFFYTWNQTEQIYQCDETNVMSFSFNLLRIKGLYIFRALLAHPPETPHKWNLVYCVLVMSVGCGTAAVYLQPFVRLLRMSKGKGKGHFSGFIRH
jgi:hypothetical protein